MTYTCVRNVVSAPRGGRSRAKASQLASSATGDGRYARRRLRQGLACVVTAVTALTCSVSWLSCKRSPLPASPSAQEDSNGLWFEEVAEASYVRFEHVFSTVQRHYLPEIMSGGVGLLDYDGDGYLDIYFVQGGDLDPSTPDRPGNRMYRNLGDGTFEDVTAVTGTGDSGYGMGCACGDYDGDGDVDIYVTNVGPNVLYRNNGDGTFTDVTEVAGVGDPGWGTSAAFTDYDGDGHLDLLIVNYLRWSPAREQVCLSRLDQRDYCGPKSFRAPAPDTLYRNMGDGTFEDVSESAGLRQAYGNGLGVAPGDFDSDGLMDFYVANDAMANQLWINAGDGRFTEEALISGCALNQSGAAEAGMGVTAVDVDNDGDLDLFMSHLRDESNTLYMNRAGSFDDATAMAGLGAPSMPYTGFGLGFADFNHDGYLDLFIANGRVDLIEPTHDPEKPYAEPNQLFKGLGNGRFKEVLPRGGTPELLIEVTRGAALGDLDNDGDVDIVLVNNNAKTHVFRNQAGSRGNWVIFRVLNRHGGYALGASVRIQAGKVVQWRQVQRAYSYCSSNDPRVHFGLGKAARVDEVTIHWPGGRVEAFGPFLANQICELREGRGRN